MWSGAVKKADDGAFSRPAGRGIAVAKTSSRGFTDTATAALPAQDHFDHSAGCHSTSSCSCHCHSASSHSTSTLYKDEATEFSNGDQLKRLLASSLLLVSSSSNREFYHVIRHKNYHVTKVTIAKLYAATILKNAVHVQPRNTNVGGHAATNQIQEHS